MSRAFRQTCRQIDREVEHEARKSFTRELTSLQRLLADENQLVTVFFSAATYHVEIVLQPPQTFFAQNLPPPVQQAQTLIDALASSCVGVCPSNTRSVTITLQPHPKASLSSLSRYFDATWSTLEDLFNRTFGDTKEGKTDLRRITILAGSSAHMVPQIDFGVFRRMLVRIAILGVSYRCDQDFQSVPSFVLDSRQNYANLAVRLLKSLSRHVEPKTFMRFGQ